MQENRVLKKESETMNTAFFANIKKVKDFAGIKSENSAVIYSGKSLPATNAGALRGLAPVRRGSEQRSASEGETSPSLLLKCLNS